MALPNLYSIRQHNMYEINNIPDSTYLISIKNDVLPYINI